MNWPRTTAVNLNSLQAVCSLFKMYAVCYSSVYLACKESIEGVITCTVNCSQFDVILNLILRAYIYNEEANVAQDFNGQSAEGTAEYVKYCLKKGL